MAPKLLRQVSLVTWARTPGGNGNPCKQILSCGMVLFWKEEVITVQNPVCIYHASDITYFGVSLLSSITITVLNHTFTSLNDSPTAGVRWKVEKYFFFFVYTRSEISHSSPEVAKCAAKSSTSTRKLIFTNNQSL